MEVFFIRRNSKYSKEVKIKVCKDYEKGYASFKEIADEIGTTKEVVRRWYLAYQEHGPMEEFFGTLKPEMSYGKTFESI